MLKKIMVCMKVVSLILVVATMTANAESVNFTVADKVIGKNFGSNAELQQRADALFKDKITNIGITWLETNGVSAGEARYPSNAVEQDEASWFDKAVDWITFWN